MVREWFGWLRGNSAAGSTIAAKCGLGRPVRPRSSFKPEMLQLEDRVVPSGFYFVANEAQLASAITAANQSGSNPMIILTNNIALATPLPTLTSSMYIAGSGYTLGSAPGATGNLGFGVLNLAGAPGAIPTVAITSLTVEGGAAASGGGVYASNANLELISDTFENNSATGSGGAVAFTDPLAATSLQVNSCTFANNTAGGCGGAIAFMGYGYSGQSLVMASSHFTQNVAQLGGAISFSSVNSAGSVNMNSCTFSCDVSTLQPDGEVDINAAAVNIGWSTFNQDTLNVTAQVTMVSYSTFNGGTSMFNPVPNEVSMLSLNSNTYNNGANWYWNGVYDGSGIIF